MSTEFYWVAAILTTIVSASRLTRLATVDKFPPVKAVREWYENRTDGSDWVWLVLCGYCFSFWATVLVVLWGWLAGVYIDDPVDGGSTIDYKIWWIVNGIFAASYAAAVFMAHDGDINDEQTVVIKEDES